MNFNFSAINTNGPKLWDYSNERNTIRNQNADYLNTKAQAWNSIAQGINNAGQQIAQGVRDYRQNQIEEDERKRKWEQMLDEQRYQRSRDAVADEQNKWRFEQEKKAAEQAEIEKRKQEEAKKAVSENLDSIQNSMADSAIAADQNNADIAQEQAKLENEILNEAPEEANAEDVLEKDIATQEKIDELNDKVIPEDKIVDFESDPTFKLAMMQAKATNSYEPLMQFFEMAKADNRYVDENAYKRAMDERQMKLQEASIANQKASEEKAKEFETLSKQYNTRLGELNPNMLSSQMKPEEFKALKGNKAEIENRLNELQSIYDWANENGDDKLRDLAGMYMQPYHAWRFPSGGYVF